MLGKCLVSHGSHQYQPQFIKHESICTNRTEQVCKHAPKKHLQARTWAAVTWRHLPTLQIVREPFLVQQRKSPHGPCNTVRPSSRLSDENLHGCLTLSYRLVIRHILRRVVGFLFDFFVGFFLCYASFRSGVRLAGVGGMP